MLVPLVSPRDLGYKNHDFDFRKGCTDFRNSVPLLLSGSPLAQIFRRARRLREYVFETEDYINIMLDDKQNHLLQMGVMLTTATLVMGAFVVVAGVFGMNIGIDLFNVKLKN
ncbi:hypothetical protein L1987_70854 [Smallanthus sonchifolius]|uniref:Uncharacterized protein n=1 Tax=Smallanthus sonchifolius TaxID=185202 RepID=A0ACB9AR53_9ASTR|nr:hypothetical protein L1987_70854 [Smallanthus sonchifolius]